MDCTECHAILDVTPPQRTAEQARLLETHLQECAACRAHSLAFDKALDLMKSRYLTPVPAGTVERVLSRLPRGPSAHASWWERAFGTMGWRGPALGAVVAAALVWGLTPLRQEPSRPGWDGIRGQGVVLTDQRVELRAWVEREGEVLVARPGERLKPGEGLRLEIATPGPGHLALYELTPSGDFTLLGSWHWEGPGPGKIGPWSQGKQVYRPGPGAGVSGQVASYRSEESRSALTPTVVESLPRDRKEDTRMIADVSTEPESALVSRQKLAEMERHLEALPEVQRMAYVLSEFDGLSVDEIAEVFDLAPITVTSYVRQVRAALRRVFQQSQE